MTGTGSDTYRAGGSDAGVSGFLSSMSSRGSDCRTQTRGRGPARKDGRKVDLVKEGRVAGPPRSGRRLSLKNARRVSSARGRARTDAALRLINPPRRTPNIPRRTSEDRRRTPKDRAPTPPLDLSLIPKAPTHTPKASSCVQRAGTPAMSTTPKTPNQHHEDKIYSKHSVDTEDDWIDDAQDTGGCGTLRAPGGRFGKTLSEASTAPTSAEGLMHQHMNREIVSSAPVPSESEAAHNGQHRTSRRNFQRLSGR
ncbi:hypothetical protein FRC10_008098, partial [Ceratobasidium sp. 414]